MYVRIKINQVTDCGNFFFIGGLEVIDFTKNITRIDYNG